MTIYWEPDHPTDPASNGEMRRNGVDMKVYSGGSVRNLSDIGGGIDASELTGTGPDDSGTGSLSNGQTQSIFSVSNEQIIDHANVIFGDSGTGSSKIELQLSDGGSWTEITPANSILTLANVGGIYGMRLNNASAGATYDYVYRVIRRTA